MVVAYCFQNLYLMNIGYLHTLAAAKTAAFIYGFVPKDLGILVKSPFISLIIGGILGGITTIPAAIIHKALPHPINPLVPVILSMSLLHNIYCYFKRPIDDSIDENNLDNQEDIVAVPLKDS